MPALLRWTEPPRPFQHVLSCGALVLLTIWPVDTRHIPCVCWCYIACQSFKQNPNGSGTSGRRFYPFTYRPRWLGNAPSMHPRASPICLGAMTRFRWFGWRCYLRISWLPSIYSNCVKVPQPSESDNRPSSGMPTPSGYLRCLVTLHPPLLRSNTRTSNISSIYVTYPSLKILIEIPYLCICYHTFRSLPPTVLSPRGKWRCGVQDILWPYIYDGSAKGGKSNMLCKRMLGKLLIRHIGLGNMSILQADCTLNVETW